MRTPIRVAVADDHALVLEAIRGRLRLDPSIHIVAAVDSGAALVRAYEDLRPDVVLTDIAMPGMSGIEATERIRAVDPKARVVCLSGYDDRATVAQAVAAGASGFVVKTIRPRDLCGVVHTVHGGGAAFDPAATKALRTKKRGPTSPNRQRPSTLSAREVQVLSLVADDMTNNEIGETLLISPLTVKTHVERILAKFGVRGRVGAVRHGIAVGVLEAHE